MVRRIASASLCAAAVALVATGGWQASRAEEVYFKNGRVLPGNVVGYDPSSVLVNTGQGTRRIPKEELIRIFFAPTDEQVRQAEEAKKAAERRKEEEAQRRVDEARRAEESKREAERAKEEERLRKEKESAEASEAKERKRVEEIAEKERQLEQERLERSKGRIKLTGRREFDTVVKEKSGDRLVVTSKVGLLSLNLTDVVSLTANTKNGVEVLKPSDIRGEVEAPPKDDEIPLKGGRVVRGTIAGMSGGLVLVNTSKGQLRLRPDEIDRKDLKLPQEERTAPTEGFEGTIVLSSGQQLRGKLLHVSENMALLQTDKGLLQFRAAEIAFVKKN